MIGNRREAVRGLCAVAVVSVTRSVLMCFLVTKACDHTLPATAMLPTVSARSKKLVDNLETCVLVM
jgi:hypothetical protein